MLSDVGFVIVLTEWAKQKENHKQGTSPGLMDWWASRTDRGNDECNTDGSRGERPSGDWVAQTRATTAGQHLVAVAPGLRPETQSQRLEGNQWNAWMWVQLLWQRDGRMDGRMVGWMDGYTRRKEKEWKPGLEGLLLFMDRWTHGERREETGPKSESKTDPLRLR